MHHEWRLLVGGNLPGARNMARDWTLLEGVAAGSGPPTIRFYGWSPPCLSLGRHQGLEAVDLGFCAHEGIDVVRRPTGGRAVLHHIELTYSVAAPLGRPPLPSGLQPAYRMLCQVLVDACRELGVAAALTEGEVNVALPGPRTTVPCFKAPAAGEVVVAGRKLVGSAMRAHGGAMLQHGSILLDWDGRLQAGAMGLANDRELRPHVTTLAEQLGRAPDLQVLSVALVRAAEVRLALRLAPGSLSPRETEREDELLPEYDLTQTSLA